MDLERKVGRYGLQVRRQRQFGARSPALPCTYGAPPDSPSYAMLRSPLALVVCLFLVACTSTSGGGSGAPTTSDRAKVTLRDYRSELAFTIVNDGYILAQGVEGEDASLRRAAFYSEREADANTKVTDDGLKQLSKLPKLTLEKLSVPSISARLPTWRRFPRTRAAIRSVKIQRPPRNDNSTFSTKC